MEPQTIWGALIAWYLFLAGVGAGAYLIGSVGQFVDERVRSLSNVGVLLGPPLVGIGCLLLLLDLGHPERFFLAYAQPFTSMIALGTWIVSVFLIVGFVQIAALVLPGLKGKGSPGFWKAMWTVGTVAAIGTAIYTGVLLGVVRSIPFWNTPLLPVLFLVSATSTGAGAVFLAAPIYRAVFGTEVAGEAVHSTGKLDVGLVVVELGLLFFYLVIMAGSGTVTAASVALLTRGSYAPAFWGGVVVVGLLVPLALETVSLRGKGTSSARVSTIAAGICLLLGGIVLRFAVLGSGIVSPI